MSIPFEKPIKITTRNIIKNGIFTKSTKDEDINILGTLSSNISSSELNLIEAGYREKNLIKLYTETNLGIPFFINNQVDNYKYRFISKMDNTAVDFLKHYKYIGYKEDEALV